MGISISNLVKIQAKLEKLLLPKFHLQLILVELEPLSTSKVKCIYIKIPLIIIILHMKFSNEVQFYYVVLYNRKAITKVA